MHRCDRLVPISYKQDRRIIVKAEKLSAQSGETALLNEKNLQ